MPRRRGLRQGEDGLPAERAAGPQGRAVGAVVIRQRHGHGHGNGDAATPRPSQPRSRCPVSQTLDHACQKDRIVVLTRDSYWLHAYWELSRTTLARAQAALGQDWHAARPILRLMDVSSEDTTSAAERHVRDIPIHGGVNNWYIDVIEPPRSYRIDIGYLSRRGKFYVLARSNVVTTPKAGRRRPARRELARRPEAVRPDREPGSIGGPMRRPCARRSTCATCSRSGCAGP